MIGSLMSAKVNEMIEVLKTLNPQELEYFELTFRRLQKDRMQEMEECSRQRAVELNPPLPAIDVALQHTLTGYARGVSGVRMLITGRSVPGGGAAG